jgi:phosphatidylglycerol:prolipoprotein diacylglycerol transferase
LLLAVLAGLIYGRRALSFPGLIAGCFLIGYALSRIAVEFYREPDAHIGYLFGGWMTMGMVLSTADDRRRPLGRPVGAITRLSETGRSAP